jgi:PTS system fructose-specific IIC component/PTS system nitrogen regulatory IIA component
MFLYDIFSPEFVKLDMDAVDKEDAFEELIDQLCQTIGSRVREDVLTALRLREAQMSTGILPGIGVPHGETSAIDRVYGVLGVSRRGIDYEALDGKPVYLLFMLMAPPRDAEKHLGMLQRLAELLQDPGFSADLTAQSTPQQVSAMIKKHEEILIALD